ncbi:hypothetical protein TWF281_010438 [Arthrobotrys megalospora]
MRSRVVLSFLFCLVVRLALSDDSYLLKTGKENDIAQSIRRLNHNTHRENNWGDRKDAERFPLGIVGPEVEEATRYQRAKRAGDEDPDIIMIDDDEEPGLGIFQSLNAGEKAQFNEAYKRGVSLQEREDDVLRNPPNQDPEFSWPDLEKAVWIKTGLRGLPSSNVEHAKDMGREDVIKNVRGYTAVFRAIINDNGKPNFDVTVLRTFVSKLDHHLLFPWPGKLPAGALYYEWIYQCWCRGSQPKLNDDSDEYEVRPPLKYVTIEDITSENTLAILKALEREWEGRDIETPIEGGLVIDRDKMDTKLVESHPNTLSSFIFFTLNVLYGVTEIAAIAEMLTNFPNTFYQHRISAIRFQVRGGGSREEATILLELEPPIQYPDIEPASNVVPLQQLGIGLQATSSKLLPHPARPDVERTSYRGRDRRGNSLAPTFSRSDVKYEETGFRFAISGVENHFVFEGYLKGTTGALILQDYSEKEVDQQMHHVIYSAWVRRAGQAALFEITFASLHPQSRNKIKDIRERRKPREASSKEWEDMIAVFEGSDRDFDETLHGLQDTREYRVIDNLLERYGVHLGISSVSRLEIGIYTSLGSKKRKGKPFMLVGFRPLVQGLRNGMEEAIEDEVVDLDVGPEETGANALRDHVPRWIFRGDRSIRERFMQALERGSYVDAMAYVGFLFFASRAGPHPTLSQSTQQQILEEYKFGIREENPIPDAARDQLNYLHDLQAASTEGPALFVGIIWNLLPPFLKGVGYYDRVEVTRAGSRGRIRVETSRYVLLLNHAISHIIVSQVPQAEDDDAMAFENVLFAAWHKRYADRKSPKYQERLSVHGPRYLSILNMKRSTQLVIEEIYTQRALEKTKPLVLTGGSATTGGRYSAAARIRVPVPDAIHYLVLLGTAEVGAAQKFASKYFGTQYMPFRHFVKFVVIRWVTPPTGGESVPELFISLKRLYPKNFGAPVHSWTTTTPDRYLSHPMLAESAVLGRTSRTIEQFRSVMPKVSDSYVSDDVWQASQLAGVSPCPLRSVQLIESGEIRFHSGAPGWSLTSERNAVKSLKTGSYQKFQVASQIEAVDCHFLVDIPKSGRRFGHIIMQRALPLPAMLDVGIERLSQVFFKAWVAASELHTLGLHAAVKSLRMVTFLDSSPETQATAMLLWQSVQRTVSGDGGQGGTATKGLVVSARVASEPWRFGGSYMQQAAWDILMGTPEIAGFSLFLRRHSNVLEDIVIHTMYMELSEDGSSIQFVVQLAPAEAPSGSDGEGMNGGDQHDGEDEEEDGEQDDGEDEEEDGEQDDESI